MPTHAVLFDLDGTLLDTIEDLADSLNAMLDALGAPGHAVEAYKHFVGDGIDVLVRRVLPEDRRNEATVARGIARAREEYGRRWQAKTRPYEGVPALLDALFARGLRVGILSNKPDDFTRLTVEALLPGWSFDLVWGVGDGRPQEARSDGRPPGGRRPLGGSGGDRLLRRHQHRHADRRGGRDAPRRGALGLSRRGGADRERRGRRDRPAGGSPRSPLTRGPFGR